jgi:AraC family transcriptional regulator, transcriptional activator FtrA
MHSATEIDSVPGERNVKEHVVAVLATPAASIVELGVPAEVLTHERYVVRYCADEPGAVALASGFWIEALGLEEFAAADTVIVPGGPGRPLDPRPTITNALRTAATRGARTVASGSGSFVLAAADLLTGRRVTTRLDLADELQHRFPRVLVNTFAPMVVDGPVRTCTGGATAVDLCRELVRHDNEPITSDDLADLIEWATARLGEPLSLADLARAAHVSPRTLARRFEATLGTSPMQWLLAQRIQRALDLLDTTREPIERIARTTGFGSTSNFRLQFAQATGVSPQAYRRQRELGRPRRTEPRQVTIGRQGPPPGRVSTVNGRVLSSAGPP